jgi:hypothetical protein
MGEKTLSVPAMTGLRGDFRDWQVSRTPFAQMHAHRTAHGR